MNFRHIAFSTLCASLFILPAEGLARDNYGGLDPLLSDSILNQEAREVFLRELEQQREDSLYTARIRMMLDSADYRNEVRDLDEIISSLPEPQWEMPYNPVTGPWIFPGYRSVTPFSFQTPVLKFSAPRTSSDATPEWLRQALTRDRIAGDFMYTMMVRDPYLIDYAYWDLPVPPRLPEDDVSFSTYIKRMDLPEIVMETDMAESFVKGRTHWLHKAQTGIQFSEAYVSSNWYQGGNNYLALLINLLWDVQLNTVYHPNYLLQSTVSYKLGLNSTPQDTHHDYSISEDLFQWNFKAGLKAFKNFFWSYNLVFKTQFLTNYETNSDIHKASFLSPGDLNMGLGMSYSYTNDKHRVKVGVSLSPLSYNLKTCIDPKMDPTQFNIEVGRKTHSEIGTNAEANIEWGMTSNISCRSRFFAFTDYTYFQSDLETTFNFSINRFLSTQLYLHLRFDSSNDAMASRWRHWMLKEILSFGLSYTFSTTPG